MENNKVKILNKVEMTKLTKSIVGVKYNKITKGSHKGLYELTYLVNPEEVLMSVWTKEQKQDLDNRFGKVNYRLDGMDKRLDGMDKRLDGMDKRLDGMDKRIDKLEGTVINLFRINGFKTE